MGHIMSELHWPKGLEENGHVFVEVLFDATGKITQVESVRSYDDRAADEAVRVIKSLPDPVEPAKQQGVNLSHLLVPSKLRKALRQQVDVSLSVLVWVE